MPRRRGERLRQTRMAKRFDGSGVVKIQCSEGAYASLKLAEMPVPRDYGEIVDGRRRVILDTRSMGADSQRYRVIWPEPSNGPGSKNRSSGFSLSASHINETLFVLAEFLRDQGVEFVKLANVHGNGFTDLRLSGSNLAYLTRGIPHSPACHVDFFTAEAPELSGSSGGVIHAPTLDSKAD
tara:strand:+ start:809 stop:1351 length:543 start_codon:yes stop_codon:yes gene_type:complete